MSKAKSLSAVALSYFIAIFSGIAILKYIDFGLILDLLCVDIVATVIIYIFSLIFKNSSMYDPYWSVIPPFLLFYYIFYNNEFNIQSMIIMFSVLFWALRLTFNWMRGWPGMHHEDWRYIDMRNYSGYYFEFSNFFGIHLFPTAIVFACCIPMKDAILKNSTDFSFILGFIICFVGVLYEIISDQQLYKFKKNDKGIIESGLWKYSRHPNYYGEILFWWGLYIYGFTFDNYFYYIFFPISMTMMFLLVSIPWIENKILRTRPKYKNYKSKVNILLPEIGYMKSFFKS